MEGTYYAKVNTPRGIVDGKMILKQEGSKLSGTVQAMGMSTTFNNGYVNGNTCKFSGTIQTIIFNIRYEAIGVLEGNKLTLEIDTNKGKFKIEGFRDIS